MVKQRTLKEPVVIKGVALHSGADVTMVINPSDANHGIIFHRVDMNGMPIPAIYDNVGGTHLRNTTIGDLKGEHVQTIEHIMAALYVVGIDNATIEIDGPETPIMDGCAESFVEMLEEAEAVEQKAERKRLRVLKEVMVAAGDSYVKLLPNENGLDVMARLIYPFPLIGDQSFETHIDKESFEAISNCRTFGRFDEFEQLKKMGMARGANETNVIAIDDEKVINPEPWGLRYKDEFVRHKIIDVVGDMLTSGYFMDAKVESYKGSHALNNEVLKKLFEDSSNYEIVE